jgi:Ca2+/Na+ antiporter
VALNDLGYTIDDTVLDENNRLEVAGEFNIPLGIYSSMMVNYPDSWGKAFRHYSYLGIIQSYLADVTGQEPSMDLEELEGSVCFIGFTATASPDAHPSPLHPQYPGIGVHTSIYNSIMNRSFLTRLSRWWNLLILVLLWGITAYITHRVSKRYAIISMISVMIAYSIIAFICFWPFGVWIDMFYPLVTMLGLYVVITFRKYIVETQKREVIEKELNIARDIQRSFLPSHITHSEALDISVNMNTARQVGGDLYDIVELSENRTAVMLGDVSGKGVPAALYMAKAVSVFKTFVRDDAPADILTRINERLVSESASNLFVTMVCTIFDTDTRSVTYAIGGHLPTLLVRPSGEVELLDVEEGMPLGMIESDFSPGRADYEPGSLFLFYSDGVTEAMNLKDEMFGQERLVKLAGTFAGLSSADAVKRVQKAVDEFAGKAPQHDDITVLAVKV